MLPSTCLLVMRQGQLESLLPLLHARTVSRARIQVPKGPLEVDHIIIEARSRRYLLAPSKELYNLLYRMETVILGIVQDTHLVENIIFKIKIRTIVVAA